MRGGYDFRGTKKGNTKDLYTTHDSGRAIDFIYMSKGLADDAVDSSFFVLSTVHPASDYDWRKDPDKTKIPAGYASDHYPIAIDVMPKDRAGGAPAGKGAPKGGAKGGDAAPGGAPAGDTPPGQGAPAGGDPD
jgi:hypothetical protein